uniref:Uncharacterized protein n=1 Tax=Solanum tuberosum TaxID=4113 RepID=M1DLZ5_SOLTU
MVDAVVQTSLADTPLADSSGAGTVDVIPGIWIEEQCKDTNMQKGTKNKRCIAKVIGDPDIDRLKLQCTLDENMKQEGDGEGRLENPRLVGDARLSSPTNPKNLNLRPV